MSLATRLRLHAPSSARARSLVGVLAIVVGSVGCSAEATGTDNASLVSSSDGDGALAPGWLLLDWSIAGDKNAEQCDLSHSATVALTVGAASGQSQSVHQATCLAFNATVQLPPGDYTAEAVLRDGAGGDLTKPVVLQPFEISSGLPQHVPLEFPRSVFYARQPLLR